MYFTINHNYNKLKTFYNCFTKLFLTSIHLINPRQDFFLFLRVELHQKLIAITVEVSYKFVLFFSEAANSPHIEEETNSELTQTSQSADHTYSRTYQSSLTIPQSHLSFTMASQSAPMYFSANQAQPTTSQSQQSLSNQSYPLQPFALIPPMVVPFHALMQANTPNLNLNDENYMMPRIVDFGALQSKMAAQMPQGFLPGFYKDCATIDAASLGKVQESHQTLDKEPVKIDENQNHGVIQDDKGVPETTSNSVLIGAENGIVNESQGHNDPQQNKLPGFEKFLDCLQPQPADNSIQDMNSRYEVN